MKTVRAAECVAQTFLSAGSRNFPVPCFAQLLGTGDWKVPRTRRLESLRYDTTPALAKFGGEYYTPFRERSLPTDTARPTGLRISFAQCSPASQARWSCLFCG